MAKIETILVVGGGVAGLTTAATLHRHGFTTELVERQQTWHALGAGFLVHTNGMRMLRSLGLAAGVENAVSVTTIVSIATAVPVAVSSKGGVGLNAEGFPIER